MMKNIDYKEITEYYVNIMSEISSIIYNTEQKYDKDSEEYKAIESSYLRWYGSKEKAYYRIIGILDLPEYYDEEDFQYFALEKFSEARHRIQNYLEDATSLLDFSEIEYEKYDDLVMDYYQPIRLSNDRNVQESRQHSFSKYHSIVHRKTMINLGLVEDISTIRESIDHSVDLTSQEKREQKDILESIFALAKQLNGYDESYRD